MTSSYPPNPAAARSLPPAAVRRLKRVRSVARWLDTAIGIPGTKLRLGMDSILGFLPVGGDVVGMALSMYVIVEAARLGAPTSLLIQMATNVAVDMGLGTVPVAGDIVDIFWKANARNLELLEEFLATHTNAAETDPEPAVSWTFLLGLLAVLLIGAIAIVAFGVWLIGAIFSAIV